MSVIGPFSSPLLPNGRSSIMAAGNCGPSRPTEARMSDDVHEVYAVRYAHHDRQSPENFIDGDPHAVLQPLAYYVWAIVGPHGPFVVDTGFDAAMARKRGRQLLKPVEEGLHSIGIRADSVEDIIVTHLHYDHTGNYDIFP